MAVIKSLAAKRQMIEAYLSGNLKPSPFVVTADGTVLVNLIITKPGVILCYEHAKEYPSSAIASLKKELGEKYRGMNVCIKWTALYEFITIAKSLKQEPV